VRAVHVLLYATYRTVLALVAPRFTQKPTLPSAKDSVGAAVLVVIKVISPELSLIGADPLL
jgi:hypothetical protein